LHKVRRGTVERARTLDIDIQKLAKRVLKEAERRELELIRKG